MKISFIKSGALTRKRILSTPELVIDTELVHVDPLTTLPNDKIVGLTRSRAILVGGALHSRTVLILQQLNFWWFKIIINLLVTGLIVPSTVEGNSVLRLEGEGGGESVSARVATFITC